MWAAVLSLIEIIFVAVSWTETRVPSGLSWSEPAGLPTLLPESLTVSV